LRREHIEVTRGHTQRQILLRDTVVGVRLGDDLAGLAQLHELAPVENALTEVYRPLRGFTFVIARTRLRQDDLIGVRGTGRQGRIVDEAL
jgi:hypothetical protein